MGAAGIAGGARRYLGVALIVAASAGVGAFLGLHFNLGGKVAAASLRYSIPQAISPEARAIYQKLIPLVAAGSTVSKPPRSAEDFARQSADGEKGSAEKAAAIMQKLGTAESRYALADVPVIELRPRRLRDQGSVIVYVHGGGWVTGSAQASRGLAALVAEAAGRRVISVDYTLAPKAQWPQVTDQIVAVYRALLDQGVAARRIGLIGESAGANLAAAGALKLRDQGLELPGALVLMSGGFDFLRRGETFLTLGPADPVLGDDGSLEAAMRLYAPDQDWGNPYVSPVYGDFSKGYAPVLLQAGTKERLLSDTVRLYQAVQTAGGIAVLDVYEGMAHVFQGYMMDTPEQKAALAAQARFWNQHLQAAAP